MPASLLVVCGVHVPLFFMCPFEELNGDVSCPPAERVLEWAALIGLQVANGTVAVSLCAL